MKARVWLSVGLLLLALPACRRQRSPSAAAPPDSEAVVARVGETVISAAALSALIAAQPPAVRQNLASPARKRDLLENEVRLELLAAEARRRGYDREPELQHALKQLLASTLINKEQGRRKIDDLLAE